MNKNRKFSSSYLKLRQRPATRAIRAALLGSATLFALVAAPAAFAQTCTDTATLEVTCSGTFTDDVANSIPPGSALPDLTLILDDTTVVTPADGVSGLTADWGGDTGVMSSANITTNGADGIHQQGTTSASLYSYGDITTEALVADDNAIDISALGDVTVVIGGDVLAYNTGAIDVRAVAAESTAGSTHVTVDEYGSVTAQAYDGYATAVGAVGLLDVGVSNSGAIAAYSTYDGALGVTAIATTGDATVQNFGTVGAYGYYSAEGVAINAALGDAIGYNSGDITAIADGGLDTSAMGIGAFGDVIGIDQEGTVVAGAYGYDSAYATGVGVLALTGASVSNYGTIGAYAYGAAGFAHALAVNATSDADVYNAGDLVAYGAGGADAVGLVAQLTGAGDVLISNYG
jgi:hypothetical protein